MTTETILLIAETEAPRIDAYLAANTEFSRSKLQKLIKEGAVEQNGKPCKANSEVKAGDAIRIHAPEENGDLLPEPENIPLDVVYEDADLAVINKPKGMVVHPALGNPSGTLVNALLYRFCSLSGKLFKGKLFSVRPEGGEKTFIAVAVATLPLVPIKLFGLDGAVERLCGINIAVGALLIANGIMLAVCGRIPEGSEEVAGGGYLRGLRAGGPA